MNRTSQLRSLGRTLGGLPLLSATLLSVVGLCWDGATRDANAQAYGGASNPVIVNYDVLNALPGQPAPYGTIAPAGGQVRSQFLPGYAPLGAPTALPPYTPYGAAPSAYQPLPVAPGLAAGLPLAPGGTPTSAITTLGPDGRPITPIKLKKPGSSSQTPKKNFAAPVQKADPVETAEPAPIPDEPNEPTQVADVTPPPEPTEMPAEVPMPAGTPPAPEPGVNADAPEVEASMPEASVPAAPAAEEPAESTESTEPPAEETPAEETATAEEAPAEPTQEAAVAPSAEQTPTEEAPSDEAPADQPVEEAAEEPVDPDNAQPAPPVPEGGIRIVFPTEMNDVPPEANAALDDLAAQMLADEDMRIQIMCYASGTVETESKARRKSLARCINIRQYLFKKDVRTTRMDVRALGLKAEGQPADRVDIVPPEAP